jgi:protein-tyrosine-phosphatase
MQMLSMAYQIRVLFVCVADAARSQLAEALLRHTDPENFAAFSAGSASSAVDPRTLEALQQRGVVTHGLYSKSMDEFQLDEFVYIISLFDKSAHEC